MIWIIVFLCILIIVLGWNLNKLNSMLIGWISPENYESFRNAVYKEFEEKLAFWKNNELQTACEMERVWALNNAQVALVEWKQQEEAKIRADAISRSEAVTKGKITEHLIPFFPDFPYNPKDCRFLGSPVDLIVFDGLSDGSLTKIVFLEIKTGKAALSTKERQIRDKVREEAVSWEELRL